MTDTIFGRWEFAVADDVYIRNGSNIGVYTFKKRRIISITCLFLLSILGYFFLYYAVHR